MSETLKNCPFCGEEGVFLCYTRRTKKKGITKVVRFGYESDCEKVIAVFGTIEDLTNAKIIQWCDNPNDKKYIIISVEETEKKGPHKIGKLYDSEDDCIAALIAELKRLLQHNVALNDYRENY